MSYLYFSRYSVRCLVIFFLYYWCSFANPAFARVRLSSFCQQGGAQIVTSGQRSSTKAQQSFPGATVNVYYTGGAAGMATSSGTTLTWTGGNLFNANSGWVGLTITYNGTPFVIASVASQTSLTTTTSLGTNATPLAWTMPSTAPAAVYSDNNNTAKSNPYTCDGTTAQQFVYVDNGTYDFRFSGTGIASPFTFAAQSGVDPVSVLRTVDAEFPGLTMQQILNITGSGGTVYVTKPWSSTSFTISGQTVICQGAGRTISPAASGTAITLTGNGSVVDGCIGDGLTVGSPIVISGATNPVIRNVTARNSVGSGVSVTNSTNVVIGPGMTFTGNAGDPISISDAAGPVDGVEVYSAKMDTTGSSSGAHCIAAHSVGNDLAANGVFGLNFHDISVTAGQTNPCIEVGYFGAGRPTPAWPAKVSISRIKIKQAQSTGTGVSLSIVTGAVVDDVQFDYNGFEGTSTEAVASNQVEWGHVVESNAPTTHLESAILNSNFNLNFHNFYLQGFLQIYSGAPASSGVQSTTAHGTVHDGQIALQSAFAGQGFVAALWIQNNLAMTGLIQDWDVHDLEITGVSTSDGLTCFYLQDNAATTYDMIRVHDNSCKSIQYGFASQGGSAWTNYSQHDNVMGAGVTWSNTFTPGGNYKLADFYQQVQTSSIGATTCVTGAGLDGSGAANCNSSLGSIVNYPGYTHGVFTVTASGSPTASGAVILTLTIPAGVFTAAPTNCQFNTRYPGLSSAAWAFLATGATTLQFTNNTGSGIPTGSYGINYTCTP